METFELRAGLEKAGHFSRVASRNKQIVGFLYIFRNMFTMKNMKTEKKKCLDLRSYGIYM